MKTSHFNVAAGCVFQICNEPPADEVLKRLGGGVPEQAGKEQQQKQEGNETIFRKLAQPEPESFHCPRSGDKEVESKTRIFA